MTSTTAPPGPAGAGAGRAGRDGRGRRLRAPLLVAGAAVTGAVALRLRDPHVQGSWGICPFSALLGVDCPGCGSLRAVNLLTHGDFAAAASSNLLLVLALPVLAALWVLWLVRAARPAGASPGPRRRVPAPVTWLLVGLLAAVVVTFTVLRNLPVGSWLHS